MNERKVKVAHKRGMNVGEAAIWCANAYKRTKNLFWLRAARRLARRELQTSVVCISFSRVNTTAACSSGISANEKK